MSVSTPPVYIITIKDVPGVVAANTFLSVLNPSSSTKIHVALRTTVHSYAAAVATTTSSMYNKRTSAHSGGTLVGASTIARFRTDWPDPASEVRIGGPAVTMTGNILATYMPVISTGTGAVAGAQDNPPGASFVILPGTGLNWITDAGDTDQIWNITYVWTEVDP